MCFVVYCFHKNSITLFTVTEQVYCFEVADKTDEVSSKHGFEVVDETDEVSNHTYGKATLTRIEEIFEEYNLRVPKMEKLD
ncbi:chlorohydrolase [Streptococcus pneumoniae]|nr:chlorohydrolase [Streptococcus pneumoniae]VMH80821.1 chlorohydrolase [Streptococcus pneumoniae]VMT69190.1 chlorohydrolase [Streptococcus pneumoniae]VNG14029.1 chlorohydrolase [Streptococcus pneumoniae]VQE44603.1 chlorohydrolase [Streptococcus pneumoniae]